VATLVRERVRRRFRRRRETPFVAGNRVTVLVDGGPFFEAYLAAIAEAKSYILIETYILRADETGWRIAEALAAKAKDGVEVALSYDSVGSFGLDETFVEFLRAAKVKVHEFSPVSIIDGAWPWRQRNHRKMLVADGTIGIIGGMNIADDYAAKEQGGQNWRDTGAQIEGPAVAQLEAMFREAWRKNAVLPITSTAGTIEPFPGGRIVRFVGNYARRDRAEIRRSYIRAIMDARHTIRIANAYFSPDPVILRALTRAARRGVQVEIITAGATDVWPVLAVSRGLYGHLLRAGIAVYEWHERILHAKTAVIDGQWSTIGSANFTHRAFLLDLEVNATILGPEIGKQMDDLFHADRSRSAKIDRALWKQRHWVERLIEWFFGFFRRLI
jgi:cardiolipin synthase A/B